MHEKRWLLSFYVISTLGEDDCEAQIIFKKTVQHSFWVGKKIWVSENFCEASGPLQYSPPCWNSLQYSLACWNSLQYSLACRNSLQYSLACWNSTIFTILLEQFTIFTSLLEQFTIFTSLLKQLEDFQLVHICITTELFSRLVNRLELHIGVSSSGTTMFSRLCVYRQIRALYWCQRRKPLPSR